MEIKRDGGSERKVKAKLTSGLRKSKISIMENKKNWKKIHSQFAQEWIIVGFTPENYWTVKQWITHGFTSRQAQEWILTGLNSRLATYARSQGYQPNIINQVALETEYNNWKEQEKTAQEYLDIFYPIEQRKNIENLIIGHKNLIGHLNKEELIRYHPIIPLKRPEKIIEHIVKLTALEYGKGEYNLLFQNCEHFATLAVCGFTFSTQVDKAGWFIPDKVNITKEIKRNNEAFDKLNLDERLTEN